MLSASPLRCGRAAVRRLAVASVLVCAACDGAGGKGGGGKGAASPTATPTYAGAAKIAEAQRQAAAGRLADASDTLAEGLRELEEASPLRIENLTFVEAAVGYGIYKPRASPVFESGEPMLVYLEPVGMSRKREGELYGIDIVYDLVTYNSQGVEGDRMVDFLRVETPSRRANRELYALLKLHAIPYPPGDYVLEVIVRDKVGGETAAKRIPFRIERK